MNNTTGNGTIILFELYSSMAQIIGYSLAYGILGSLALAGNLTVLLVVFMNKSMRTTINVLLFNLSLSDVLYILLSVPGYLSTEICNQRWMLGLVMAIICQGFAILTAAASVFTLIGIAFERYFAIVHPLKSRTRNTKNRTIILAIGAIWLCSAAFAAPFAIATKTVAFPLPVEENGQITVQDITFLNTDMDIGKFKIYYTSIFIGLHVVPFVSLGIMYTTIAWKLWHPDKQLSDQFDSAGGKETASHMSERNRRKTTIMVIAVLLAFFVCFFPFHIYFISEIFKDDYEYESTTETSVLRVCLILNAAINPVIYNLLSENFRSGFRKIFGSCWCIKHEVNASSVDTIQAVGNLSR